MTLPVILASASEIRAQLLRRAGVDCSVQRARVDEQAIRDALIAEGAPARDIADALAEAKARKIAGKSPGALVIGCDQVLAFDGTILSKPRDPDEARRHLTAMRGKRHHLYSAAVIHEGPRPVWRHVGAVEMVMRPLSDGYIDSYVTRNWDSIRHSVGAYKLEEEGARLFSAVKGDYFTVLGLPLLDILTYLATRGELET